MSGCYDLCCLLVASRAHTLSLFLFISSCDKPYQEFSLECEGLGKKKCEHRGYVCLTCAVQDHGFPQDEADKMKTPELSELMFVCKSCQWFLDNPLGKKPTKKSVQKSAAEALTANLTASLTLPAPPSEIGFLPSPDDEDALNDVLNNLLSPSSLNNLLSPSSDMQLDTSDDEDLSSNSNSSSKTTTTVTALNDVLNNLLSPLSDLQPDTSDDEDLPSSSSSSSKTTTTTTTVTVSVAGSDIDEGLEDDSSSSSSSDGNVELGITLEDLQEVYYNLSDGDEEGECEGEGGGDEEGEGEGGEEGGEEGEGEEEEEAAGEAAGEAGGGEDNGEEVDLLKTLLGKEPSKKLRALWELTKKWFAVLTFDGELALLKAMLAETTLKSAEGLNLVLIKYAANCTAIQQPLDVGRFFLTLKNYLKKEVFIDTVTEPADQKNIVDAILKAMGKKEKKEKKKS